MIIGIDASRANQRVRTGTEWYAWELIKRLPALLSSHTLRLYVREELMEDFMPLGPNVEVHVLRWPPGVLWSHLRLSWEMLWHRPDVLFVPANTVPLIHPANAITTIHDVAFERFPELYRGRSVQRRLGWLRPFMHLAVRIFTLGRYSASERDYHRWSSRQAIRSSKVILTVSEFSKREIAETLSADPEKIVVTHLAAAQPEAYDLPPIDIHRTLQHFHLLRPYILFLGRLETKKNIDGVVKAYQHYRALTKEPLDLILIGQPGFGWEAVEPEVKVLMNQKVVHHIAWVSPEQKIALQKSAQVFLFISRYEGFGLPPLEAMSAGVPVVASRVGSLPEILHEAAYFVEPDDTEGIARAIDVFATDQAVRQKYILAGRKLVRQYSWAATAEKTAEQIERIADLPRR